MNYPTVRKVILISIVIGVIFVSGYTLGTNGFKLETASFPKVKISREIPDDKRDVDFALFWRIWDTLDNSYYDKSKISPQKMVYGAISGMVSALGDPYTAFLPPEENKVVEEDLSGSFEGVGIQIGFKGKNLAVIAPLPGSPAEKEGVKAGDFIVGIADSIKGVDIGTFGITLSDAVKLIRGKAGTKVTLLLIRDGKDDPIKVEITRENLDVPSVITTFIDPSAGEAGSIAHIKLLKFGADTDSEWAKAVGEITNYQLPITKIILDLRNNPGGYLQGAVDIAGEFVKKDSIIVIEDRGKTKNNFATNRTGKFGNMKVVVLVNGGSASASEILAGALSEIKGYKLIGEKTFGKGTIQEPLQLEKGSSLHITVAKWLTPKGTWVNEKGIEPDVIILDKDDTTEDEQLQEAIKLLEQV
ncbi:MAG: S41 family peptidase [Candidatus Woesebacteria bacterium]|nr:S41 family peptidase [Candidatus Woesebacteria bacterium]